MKISEVQIQPIKPHDGLVAFASAVLNDELYISSIGVHKKLAGQDLRITYPTRKVGDRNLQVFHPINREASEAIEAAIVEKAKQFLI